MIIFPASQRLNEGIYIRLTGVRYISVLCRTNDAEEKCSTLGGSKTPVSLASSGEMIQRMPGVCLVFSDSVSEVPPVFTHMLENLPAIYETVIFVTVRSALPLVDILCQKINYVESLVEPGSADLQLSRRAGATCACSQLVWLP